MRSHLQFGAVLDNAVIRLEMQKSSLKLNNIFVTVLRGADCLEPCWSLDLEYFGVVLTVESVKITSEHPVGGFVVGAFGSRLQALAFPWSHPFRTGSFLLPSPNRAVLRAPGRGAGGRIGPCRLQTGGCGCNRGMDALRRSGPCLGSPASTQGVGLLRSPPISFEISCLAARFLSLFR